MSYPANPPPYSGPQQGVQMVQLQPVVISQPGHVTTVPIVIGQQMGTEPSMVVCQTCNYQILTKTEVRPAAKTHLWALCLCVIGLWPCMWIPYCTPACMNVNHYCPNCNGFIGNY